MMEHHILIDEKMGDVDGDGFIDRVRVYGDKAEDSDFIHNILIHVKIGQSFLNTDVITELNGYHPAIFLGDFTKDQADDILFRMDCFMA